MGKFVVRETATGSKFDLKAGNGEVIATSQVYASKASCLKGVESVKENAPSPLLRIGRRKDSLSRRTPSSRYTPIRPVNCGSA